MERKKPQKSTIDELALVKAAAWAWHQHGSGSEGKAKSKSEFHATRTQHAARPSRYKLEAMRMAKEAKEEGSQIHTNKKSLFDTFEIQSISRQLDRLIEAGHDKLDNGNGNGNNFSGICNRRMNKKRTIKGSLLRHGAVCGGGGGDVVDGKALTCGRLSAKRVPVVDLAKCLAKANYGAL